MATFMSHIVLITLQVVFWKWVTSSLLGLVTQTAVYHWSIEGEHSSQEISGHQHIRKNRCEQNSQCSWCGKALHHIAVN